MKNKYNLSSILAEDDKSDLSKGAQAGVSSTLKGKPEQKVIAQWVNSNSAIQDGNYQFIAVTKMGPGPDVLIRNNDTGEYFELEVKSAGGKKTANSAEDSFSTPISVSFKPSGTTGSGPLKKLADLVKSKNNLSQKQAAVSQHFSNQTVLLTPGFFDNLEFADGSHETKSGGLYEELKDKNITFQTSHVCHVALGTAFILKLSNFGPDIQGQKLISDATAIEAGAKGIDKITFGGNKQENLTDTGQQTVWAEAFPQALINAIATMATKPSWSTFLTYLSATPVSDPEFDLIKLRQASYGLDVSADKDSIDWSLLLMEMCTSWADWNQSDVQGYVVDSKRRGFGIDGALPKLGTAFWTCGFDNLVAVPYLPKDMPDSRCSTGREKLFFCLEKIERLQGKVSNTVTQAFRSNLRVSTTRGSTASLYSASDNLPTKVGFFTLKAISENLASIPKRALEFADDCTLENIVKLFVGTKWNKLNSKSKALINKYPDKFTAKYLVKICNDGEIDNLIEDIILNSPMGGGTVPISAAWVEETWNTAGDDADANRVRQLNGLLNAVFSSDKAKKIHGINPKADIQARDRKSLDAFEPSDVVDQLSDISLSDLEDYPKVQQQKKQFQFWLNIMNKVSRITRMDDNIKSAINLSSLDGNPDSLSKYDLYSALGFNVESKQRVKPTLMNILFENENQEIEDVIDNIEGVDSVDDAAALVVKKTTDSSGGIDQVLNKMETLGLMVLRDAGV